MTASHLSLPSLLFDFVESAHAVRRPASGSQLPTSFLSSLSFASLVGWLRTQWRESVESRLVKKDLCWICGLNHKKTENCAISVKKIFMDYIDIVVLDPTLFRVLWQRAVRWETLEMRLVLDHAVLLCEEHRYLLVDFLSWIWRDGISKERQSI